MKKYLVIGNPIEHSLSPKLHNYWFKQNNIDAIYLKKQITETEIEEIILEIRNEKVAGINVTVPFKKSVIPFLDGLEDLASKAQSVNTVYKKENKIIGANTDINGFINALNHIKYNVSGKKVLVLGAGGVTSSIILALEHMKASSIMLSNRTKEKAENLKKTFRQLELIKWGDIKKFDMIVNTTSVGLKANDNIPLNYDQVGSGKLFYDLIYNPGKTNFLLKAKASDHNIENGKMMFIYQAAEAFKIWTGLVPSINKETLQLLEND